VHDIIWCMVVYSVLYYSRYGIIVYCIIGCTVLYGVLYYSVLHSITYGSARYILL